MEFFTDFQTFTESFLKPQGTPAPATTSATAPAAAPAPVAPAAPAPAPAQAPTPAPVVPAPAAPAAPAKPAVPGLQQQLKSWVQEYSQSFKFINDRPLPAEYTKTPTGQFSGLVDAIAPEKRAEVKAAIAKVTGILADPRFAGQQVLVLGHTSTPGPKGREVPYNQALSVRRAGIVYNAIREVAQQEKKDVSKIKFSVVGKGLSDPIIANDKTLDPLKLKKMDGEFDAQTLLSLSKSVEERQKINRRVIITLPHYKEPVPVVKVAPAVEEPVFDVRGITFYDDSYLLTKAGRDVLDKVVKTLHAKEKSGQPVKTVYIGAHTEKGKGDAQREQMMFVLSLNRAFCVSNYLENRLPGVKFVRYGCGSQISPSESDVSGFTDEKRVEISLDKDLPKAKAAFVTLSAQYKVAPTEGVTPNPVMKETIKKAITLYVNDRAVRAALSDASSNGRVKVPEYCEKIPREFWMETVFTAKGEEEPTKFKQEVEHLLVSLNKKYGTSIPANAFFHKDLSKNIGA